VADDPFDRTRTMIARGLGVAIAPRELDAYRDPAGERVGGEWLGGFAQTGTLLARYTAMSMSVDDDRGAAMDEYGESTLRIVARGGELAFDKRYASGDRFVFHGRAVDGAIAGIWYQTAGAPLGVFWLARVDRLAASTADALRGKIHVTSKRLRWLGIAYLTMCAGVSATLFVPTVGLASITALAITAGLSRTPWLRSEIAAWQRELGDPSI
jgi:hypothetical protein